MLYEKVMEYCRRNQISVYKFEALCDLGNGAVGKWKDGEPRLETIYKIAEKTGIPVERWIK